MHRPWPFVSVFRLLLLLEGSSCWVCSREGAGTRRSLWGWRGAHGSAGTDGDVRAALRTHGLFPFPTPPSQGSWAQGEGPVSPSALNQIRSCEPAASPALLEVVPGQL